MCCCAQFDHDDDNQRADAEAGWDPSGCTVENCEACVKIIELTSNPQQKPSHLAALVGVTEEILAQHMECREC